MKKTIAIATLFAASLAGAAETVVVTPSATKEALINPGMGFMFYRNAGRLWAYGSRTPAGDTLDWFPGCSTMYFRLLWSELEPTEGQYRWDLIDSFARNWITVGKQICIRVICCNQTANATPDWVCDAGAKGDNRTDSIPAFDAAIAAAVKLAGKPCVIEIPEGDFRFSPTNRRTHLNLAGVTNCVLRGVSPEKTRLWFDDMDTCGTMISDAVNATIENVDLASTRTPFFQGVVREFNKSEGWAIVEQEPGTMRPDDEIFLKGAKMQYSVTPSVTYEGQYTAFTGSITFVDDPQVYLRVGVKW